VTCHHGGSGVRCRQRGEDVDGRGLARAVGPEKAEDLPGIDLEVDTGDRVVLAVALAQVAYEDGRGGAGHGPMMANEP